MIGARLRHGSGWTDARIVNLSSRGLMARAPCAPAPGSYVEICRGTHRIVARVVWAESDRFGALSQDAIPVEAIATGEDASPPPIANAANDRCAAPRVPAPSERHERNRRRARRAEFACVAAFGAAAAFFAFDTVSETLARPLALVEARLGKG
jgi:hypothetical protein